MSNLQSIAHIERMLLTIAAIFVTINQTMLLIVQDRPVTDFWIILAWGSCAVFLHMLMNHALPQRDPLLLPAALLLIGWGLTTIDRLQPHFADRQTIWLIFCTAILAVIVQWSDRLRWLSQRRWYLMGCGLLSLLTTLILGVNPSGLGPRLWLGFSGIYFQPGEIIKLIMIIFMAAYFEEHSRTMRQHLFSIVHPRLFVPLVILPAMILGIFALQLELGTAIIFFSICVLMLYLATGHLLVIVAGFFATFTAFGAGYLVYDLVRLRVDVWLNPWPQADGSAFQIVQSVMAVSAGGLPGAGVGQGMPDFIPVVHSDFVYAAIAEEWGFAGVTGLLFTLMLIIFRGFRIAMQLPTMSFEAFMAAGISVLFAVQSLLILGGTLRLWPLTGVTLPFVSYGGSSLLSTCISVGLLLILSNRQS